MSDKVNTISLLNCYSPSANSLNNRIITKITAQKTHLIALTHISIKLD